MSEVGSRGVTTFTTKLFATKELAEAFQIESIGATLHEMRLLDESLPSEWIVVIPE